MPGYLYLVNLIILCICIVVDSVISRTLPPVHWYSDNTIFKSSNNDHMIDVNMSDDIDFYCPHYPNGTDPDTHEYYVIYRVSKESYEQCNTKGPDNMRLQIVNCSKPTEKKRVTISIISFSPVPSSPEFHKGQTYYFITTSGGKQHQLNNEREGACDKNNMKLSLKVCCESTTTSTTTTTSSTLVSSNYTSLLPTHAPPTQPPAPNITTNTTTTKDGPDQGTSTSASSPSTTTTISRQSTSAKWRASTTSPPRTTTKKYRDNEGTDDENEVGPKAGSHVNSGVSAYTRTAFTGQVLALFFLTHALLRWFTTR